MPHVDSRALLPLGVYGLLLVVGCLMDIFSAMVTLGLLTWLGR